MVGELRPKSGRGHIRRRGWARHLRLLELGFADYRAYLRSATWRAVKAHYRASDRPQACVCCDERDVDLHHLTYERVGGDELLTDLVPLCRRCHQLMHALEARGECGLDPATIYDEERAAEHRLAKIRDLAAQRQYLRSLPLAEQIAILRRVNSRAVRGHLRVIEHRVRRAERAAAGSSQEDAAKHLKAVEALPRLIDSALEEQLVGAETLTPVDCDGSMVCECDGCEQERAERVRRGVRARRSIPKKAA